MKFLPSVFIIVLFFGACKVDNTQKVFDSISLGSENHSFVFMLASNQNYFSTLAQEAQFNKMFSGSMPGVDASKIDGFVIFPDGSGLNGTTATAFKSLYDANGSGTFTFYPAVYENMADYSVQYSTWKNAAKTTYAGSAVCAVGTKIENFGKNVNVYVKSQLISHVDSAINAAVYVVNESIAAPQDTSLTNSDPAYIHSNVLKSSINTYDFGVQCSSNSVGATNKNTFSYLVPEGVDRNKLKFVVVIFEMSKGLPKRVLNTRTIRL